MSTEAEGIALRARLRKAQHELDELELTEDRAFAAYSAARKARQVAADAVWNLQQQAIDASGVV